MKKHHIKSLVVIIGLIIVTVVAAFLIVRFVGVKHSTNLGGPSEGSVALAR